MFDFGDELIIDSYRIPWLIWIQLVAMLLLLILLYYFTTTPSDLSLHFSTAAASPSSTGLSYVNHSVLTSPAANTHRVSKVRDNEIKETRASTSEVVVVQREGNDGMTFEGSHHLCHFFGLAKQAFLKCLGFDSNPDNSSTRQTKKDD